jgi:hypothetical protein
MVRLGRYSEQVVCCFLDWSLYRLDRVPSTSSTLSARWVDLVIGVMWWLLMRKLWVQWSVEGAASLDVLCPPGET